MGDEMDGRRAEPDFVQAQQRLIDLRGVADQMDEGPRRGLVQQLIDAVLQFLGASVVVFEEPSGNNLVISDWDDLSYQHVLGHNIDPKFISELLRDIDVLETTLRAELGVEGLPGMPLDQEHAVVMVGRIASSVLDAIDATREKYRTITPLKVRERINKTLRHIRNDVGRCWHRSQELELVGVTERAKVAVASAESASEAASRAAGLAGTATMYEHFESLARLGARRGAMWLLATLALLGIYAMVSYSHLVSADPLSSSELLRRAGIALPLLAMVGLTARESTVYRNHGLWAQHVAVQLKSVEAFAEALDDEAEQHLLESFGRVVFAGPPKHVFGGQDKASESHDSALVSSEVLALLQKIVRRAT